MSSGPVLDASAVLAYLQEERGRDVVEAALDAGPAQMTTVNYCEVLGKLCDKGVPIEEAQRAVFDLRLALVEFNIDLAHQAAAMRLRTKSIGASLGDRACLALALRNSQRDDHAIVYTAEQSWAKVKWPFKVVVIRGAGVGH